MANVSVTINGQSVTRDVEPRTLLVHFVREECGLTGTNIGCDTSSCGACTIHLDGESIKSCTMFAAQADGRQLTTIEGMATNGDLHPLQKAFWEKHGLQCGYCTPGFVMCASSLVSEHSHLTSDEARDGLSGNICRCTGYESIVDALIAVSGADRS